VSREKIKFFTRTIQSFIKIQFETVSSSSTSSTTSANQERTAKKEGGTVQKVLKFGLVGDGTVGMKNVDFIIISFFFFFSVSRCCF
jgi:hypothetical protein